MNFFAKYFWNAKTPKNTSWVPYVVLLTARLA